MHASRVTLLALAATPAPWVVGAQSLVWETIANNGDEAPDGDTGDLFRS
ncbi:MULTISPECIES: hypothetical protein [unclassified Wenzhouxiangella]|nr:MULTISPECIES: hypothetical protein [unclassified Wenzhouxiangella]